MNVNDSRAAVPVNAENRHIKSGNNLNRYQQPDQRQYVTLTGKSQSQSSKSNSNRRTNKESGNDRSRSHSAHSTMMKISDQENINEMKNDPDLCAAKTSSTQLLNFTERDPFHSMSNSQATDNIVGIDSSNVVKKDNNEIGVQNRGKDLSTKSNLSPSPQNISKVREMFESLIHIKRASPKKRNKITIRPLSTQVNDDLQHHEEQTDEKMHTSDFDVSPKKLDDVNADPDSPVEKSEAGIVESLQSIDVGSHRQPDVKSKVIRRLVSIDFGATNAMEKFKQLKVTDGLAALSKVSRHPNNCAEASIISFVDPFPEVKLYCTQPSMRSKLGDDFSPKNGVNSRTFSQPGERTYIDEGNIRELPDLGTILPTHFCTDLFEATPPEYRFHAAMLHGDPALQPLADCMQAVFELAEEGDIGLWSNNIDKAEDDDVKTFHYNAQLNEIRLVAEDNIELQLVYEGVRQFCLLSSCYANVAVPIKHIFKLWELSVKEAMPFAINYRGECRLLAIHGRAAELVVLAPVCEGEIFASHCCDYHTQAKNIALNISQSGYTNKRDPLIGAPVESFDDMRVGDVYGMVKSRFESSDDYEMTRTVHRTIVLRKYRANKNPHCDYVLDSATRLVPSLHGHVLASDKNDVECLTLLYVDSGRVQTISFALFKKLHCRLRASTIAAPPLALYAYCLGDSNMIDKPLSDVIPGAIIDVHLTFKPLELALAESTFYKKSNRPAYKMKYAFQIPVAQYIKLSSRRRKNS